MWWKIILLVIIGLAVIIIVALLYGSIRWQAGTKEIHTKLNASRLPIVCKTYDSKEIDGLPAPVQRYFRTVLKDGQPMIADVSVEHSGTFNMSATGQQWKPFTSTQRVITHRPGFDWEARIQLMPGLAVKVHDAYVAGEGILYASLFGFVTLANVRGTPEVAHGELMRFFAEAAWYPTKLLPSQGVQWESVDDNSAKATLNDGETNITLLFRFGENSLIESVRAEARERIVDGDVIKTPWEGRFSRYELRDGMIIPLEGEVTWILPEGSKPYWHGSVTKLTYGFAQ